MAEALCCCHAFAGALPLLNRLDLCLAGAGRPNAYRSVAELLAAPQLSSLLSASTALDAAAAGGATGLQANVSDASCNGNSSSTASAGPQGQHNKRLALVFGREVSGLTAAEVDMCDATLSIPIGRLQGEGGLSRQDADAM